MYMYIRDGPVKLSGEYLTSAKESGVLVKKFGAIVGDNVEVGCNSVLNPGTVVGRNTNIYPLSMVRGVVEENSIYKKKGEVAEKI